MEFVYFFSCLILIIVIYFLISKKSKKTFEKKSSGKNQKQQDLNYGEIIREAEALFKTLKSKYPKSPLPYKTLGDFYSSKGMADHALIKYHLMVDNLNQELTILKLDKVLDFLLEQNKPQLISKIKQFYQTGR